MRKKTDDSFSVYYDKRIQRKDISNTSLYFIVSGLIFTIVFSLRAIVNVGITAKASIAIALIGLLWMLLGVLVPRYMISITKILSRLFNRIGIVLIRVLLFPVYCVTFLATFLYARNRRRGYCFEEWKKDRPVKDSFFEQESENLISRKRGFLVLGSILSGISVHHMYILLPLIIVLLAIGLLFFFVSSSTVFSFIYTFV